jgi:hypothetical protein
MYPEYFSFFNPLKPKLVFKTFKRSLHTSKKTQPIIIKHVSSLTLFKEIIAVHLENLMKPINVPRGNNVKLLTVKGFRTYNYN